MALTKVLKFIVFSTLVLLYARSDLITPHLKKALIHFQWENVKMMQGFLIEEEIIRFFLNVSIAFYCLLSDSSIFLCLIVQLFLVKIDYLPWDTFAKYCLNPNVYEANKTQLIYGVQVAIFTVLIAMLIFKEKQTKEQLKKVEMREKLVAFYRQHNVEKIGNVDKILNKYAGNYDLLFARLVRKYEVESAVASSEEEESEVLEYEAENSEADDEEVIVSDTSESQEEDIEIEREVNQLDLTSNGHDNTPEKMESKSFEQKSDTNRSGGVVLSAIDEARKAQQARIDERIKQLSSKKK